MRPFSQSTIVALFVPSTRSVSHSMMALSPPFLMAKPGSATVAAEFDVPPDAACYHGAHGTTSSHSGCAPGPVTLRLRRAQQQMRDRGHPVLF